ncbi:MULTISPECIES: fimbrial protein [unclassified Pseudomonas]|uniref:fimbrial protein n=1 Tax=unclassified Pseudomonas TaxID=196821 RepID=UPI0030DCFFCE
MKKFALKGLTLALVLGAASQAAMAADGEINTTAPGCNVAGKKAVVKFLSLSGNAGASGQWLGLVPEAGVATNVAVQIKDASGKDLQLGLESSPYLDLTQPLRFTANYIATGVATSGPANAKAAFTVDYQ